MAVWKSSLICMSGMGGEQGLGKVRLELRRKVRSSRGKNRQPNPQDSRERRKERRGKDHKYHLVWEWGRKAGKR